MAQELFLEIVEVLFFINLAINNNIRYSQPKGYRLSIETSINH